MPVHIPHTERGNPLWHWDIIAAKMEKGDMRPQRGVDIRNQRQNVNNGDLSGIILVDATALVTARSLYNPEMLTELAPIHIYMKLLCPEIKDSKQIIRSMIAIVPAINQAKRLGMPIPTGARPYRSIHCVLHLVEVVDLAYH